MLWITIVVIDVNIMQRFVLLPTGGTKLRL